MSILGKTTTIVAVHSKTIYESDDFFILSMESADRKNIFPDGFKKDEDSIVAKGRFAAPDYKGQRFELIGSWGYDSKYKKFTFSVDYAIPIPPKTEKEAIGFFTSIRGIGQKTAEKIVLTIGYNLEGKNLDAKILAASVKGLKLTTANALVDKFKRINVSAELTKMLKSVVSSETIRAIAVAYAGDSIDIIKNAPYDMAIERTVSFGDADAIGRSQGWDKLARERIFTCIICSMRYIKLRTAAIIVEKESLIETVMSALKIPLESINNILQEMYGEDLVVAGKYVYLRNDYIVEKRLATIIAYYKYMPISDTDEIRYLEAYAQWQKEEKTMVLAERQIQAVKAVAKNWVSIVTGGPGTGKTTVLKAIIETYKKAFPKSPITLMAPTGLAAKRMTEACGMQAQTIHKALGLIPADNDSGFNDADGLTINGGLVIIDEFSMVGIHLASFLFGALLDQPDLRVVIVGDTDQLPPVSPGAVLGDFIECGCVTTTRLNRNFRQEAGSAIIDAAYAINAGNSYLNFVGNFQLKEVSNENLAIETQTILEDVKIAFLDSVKNYGLSQTFVLAPRRKTSFRNGEITTDTILATGNLNPILRDIVNPPRSGVRSYKHGPKLFREGDRVINIKNIPEVMNGEIGYIEKIDDSENIPIITVDFDGKKVEYTPENLKQLELAYAITVHKAQGAEYKSIIFPSNMTQACMLERNLLYTAVTRAKNNVLIIGSKKSIAFAVSTVKNKVKRDLLKARIIKYCDKKLR